MSGTSEARASCKECSCRTDEKPPFCTWLKAEIPPGLPDDPECEGFAPRNTKSPEKKNAKAPMSSRQIPSSKGANVRVSRTCPKAPLERERQDILQAIKIKTHGSVIKQLVKCGKAGCQCSSGRLHGPYYFWRFFEDGCAEKKYLGKNLPILLDKSLEELQSRLREVDKILEQESKAPNVQVEPDIGERTRRSSEVYERP